MNIPIRRLPALCLALIMLASSASATNLVLNGDFDGYTGNTNYWASTTPPNWTTLNLSPDTFDGNTDFQGFKWSSSQTGGDFLHALGYFSGGESFYQVITGLVVGMTYEFSFEQSISASNYGYANGKWGVQLGSQMQFSSTMVAPYYGSATTWQWQTMSFTATAATEQLTLTGFSADRHVRSEMAIDGIYLGAPGGREAANVPDSGSILLLLVEGLLGLVVWRKRSVQAARSQDTLGGFDRQQFGGGMGRDRKSNPPY